MERAQSLKNFNGWHLNIKKPAKLRAFQVGRTGFEPATPWSQTTYSTGLNYLPNEVSITSGGEGGIRTLGRDLSPYDGLANR